MRCETSSCNNSCQGSGGRCACFSCGLGTCQGCSSKILYLGYGQKRVCRDCQYDMARFGDLSRPTACLTAYFSVDQIEHLIREAKEEKCRRKIEVAEQILHDERLEDRRKACPAAGKTPHAMLIKAGKLRAKGNALINAATVLREEALEMKEAK